MIELGMKEDSFVGFTKLVPLEIPGRPRAMPALGEGEEMICGLDETGEGEKLIVCDTFAEMIELYDRYVSKNFHAIYWYIGATPSPQPFPERPLPPPGRAGTG